MAFELPALPYDYDALQTYMSRETLEYHHDKHHNAYVDNGNKLAAEAGMDGLSLEEIVKQSFGKNAGLFNNAGQHYNHIHFWNWMKPNGGGKSLPGALETAFQSDLGGYDNALVLDMLGNVAETGSSNIFMAKDGEVFTPAANGTFLAGITRSRTMKLLAEAGTRVTEKALSVRDFLGADEIFSTGNHSKVVPITKVEDREYGEGSVSRRLRDLYFAWAKATAPV